MGQTSNLRVIQIICGTSVRAGIAHLYVRQITGRCDGRRTIAGFNSSKGSQRPLKAGVSEVTRPSDSSEQVGTTTRGRMLKLKRVLRFASNLKHLVWQPSDTMELGEHDAKNPRRR